MYYLLLEHKIILNDKNVYFAIDYKMFLCYFKTKDVLEHIR